MPRPCRIFQGVPGHQKQICIRDSAWLQYQRYTDHRDLHVAQEEFLLQVLSSRCRTVIVGTFC
jgi:hypothetical protein